MTDKSNLMTLTLAKVYAAQGKQEKALEIVRALLKKDPENKNLKKEFRRLTREKSTADATENSASVRLTKLFQEWFDLLLRLDRIRKLKRASAFTSGAGSDVFTMAETLKKVIRK